MHQCEVAQGFIKQYRARNTVRALTQTVQQVAGPLGFRHLARTPPGQKTKRGEPPLWRALSTAAGSKLKRIAREQPAHSSPKALFGRQG